jgi:hypothetical protein
VPALSIAGSESPELAGRVTAHQNAAVGEPYAWPGYSSAIAAARVAVAPSVDAIFTW